ncbi:MAG: multiheme c-type cytochrome [Candidatus Latescibacterota bacterium]
MADTLDAAAGLQEALIQGCFECHRVKPLRGPRLRLPVDTERARVWLRAHDVVRGELPATPLTDPQTRAMAAALAGEARHDSVSASRPFWELPVARQGDPPELFDAGRRLEPAACGQCHTRQLDEWRSSRHAAAFSPGLRAQLVDTSPGFIEECLGCHTPLREQIDRALSLQGDLTAIGPAGVDCAGCHVRDHRYYGPGQPGNLHRLVAGTIEVAHHGGVEAAPDLFGGESFCAPCHQFDADGLALEGKLLQNTYGEWLAIGDAGQERTCQGCHMPVATTACAACMTVTSSATPSSSRPTGTPTDTGAAACA